MGRLYSASSGQEGGGRVESAWSPTLAVVPEEVEIPASVSYYWNVYDVSASDGAEVTSWVDRIEGAVLLKKGVYGAQYDSDSGGYPALHIFEPSFPNLGGLDVTLPVGVSRPCTIFIGAYLTNSPIGGVSISGLGSGYILNYTDGTNIRTNLGSGFNWNPGALPGWHLLEFQFTGTSSSDPMDVYVDGSYVASRNNQGVPNGFEIGSNNQGPSASISLRGIAILSNPGAGDNDAMRAILASELGF